MVVLLCQLSCKICACKNSSFWSFLSLIFHAGGEENPDSWVRELGYIAFEILGMVGMVSNYSELSVQSPHCSI